MSRAATVRAVNALAARWSVAADEGGTVLMPAGVWPLLAFLAAGADGPALGELEDALGMRTATAVPHARELLDTLRTLPGSRAALGLWTSHAWDPTTAWLAELPTDIHGRLSGDGEYDRKLLDAWADRSTDGLVDTMPVDLTPDTRLVLAAALTVRTDWIRPFSTRGLEIENGPWTGRDLGFLGRTTGLLDRAALVETPNGPVTEVRVLGANGIDVHLLLGAEDARPATVLSAGLGILDHTHPRVTADRLPSGSPGPGLTVGWTRSYDRDPQLHLAVPAFTVEADHDLLVRPDLFGLTAASDASAPAGHFPGITTAEPLCIGSARQSATATFGELGFRASSVTAFGIAIGAASAPPPYRVRHVEAAFDRPFGFLAVHRTSRLVLAAGWVTEPAEFAPEAYDDLMDDDL